MTCRHNRIRLDGIRIAQEIAIESMITNPNYLTRALARLALGAALLGLATPAQAQNAKTD